MCQVLSDTAKLYKGSFWAVPHVLKRLCIVPIARIDNSKHLETSFASESSLSVCLAVIDTTDDSYRTADVIAMGYKRTAKVAATARDMRSTRTSTTVANRVTVAPVAKVKAAHGKSLAMNRKRLTPTVNKRHPIVWIDNTGFDFGAYPAWPKMSKPTKQTAASVESSDAVFDGDSTPGSADDNAIAPHGNLNHAVETHDSDAEDANITDDDAAAFDGGGDSDSADLEGHSDNSVAADAAAADVSGDDDDIDVTAAVAGDDDDFFVNNDTSPSHDSDDDSVIETGSNQVISSGDFSALPFFKEFRTLASLHASERDAIYAETTRLPVDVDKWEVAMSPTFYLRHIDTPVACVRLASHAPKSKPRRKDEPKTPFDGWLLLADDVHLIFVDPAIKAPFYRELKKTHIVRPSRFPWVSSTGGAAIPIRRFVECLQVAHCSTIRLKQYGQKMPIDKRYITRPIADAEHRLSEHNEWDIGTNFESSVIWLLSPVNGNISRHLTTFPMIIPGSLDYGSVQIITRFKHRDFRIKIYPRLVHVIKSINSRLQGEPPQTVRNIKRKGAAAQAMVQELTTISSKEMGGFRIEVSVRARTLGEAQRIVNDTGFLRPSTWVNSSDGPLSRFRLDVKVVTKQGLIDNANWVYRQSVAAGIYTGNDHTAATSLDKRTSLDVFNSLGWNAGLRTPTRSLDPVAWWRTVEISDEAMTEVELLAILNRLYPTDLDKRNLVAIIRTKGKKKGFPCRKNEKHSYDIKARHPPRWQCRDKSCKDNLPLGQAMRWVAQLIINDWVPRQAVGLPSARRQSDTADDSRRVTNDELGFIHRTPLSSVTPPRRIDKAFRPPPAINRLRFEVPGMSRLVRLPVEPVYYRTRWTIGDGNCQFRAFAKAYGGIDHIAARKAAVDYMFENFKQFEAFYADDEMEKQYGDFDMYLDAMAKQFEYGDQLTLAALAASYEVSIKVLHMSHTLDYEWVDGGDSDSGRVIKLFFNAGTKHYENLVAARDL